MAENTSSEEQKPKGGSAIDKFKNEVGPIGFIGAIVGLVVLVGASVIFFLNFRNDSSFNVTSLICHKTNTKGLEI